LPGYDSRLAGHFVSGQIYLISSQRLYHVCSKSDHFQDHRCYGDSLRQTPRNA
jgi:hypothetical protein